MMRITRSLIAQVNSPEWPEISFTEYDLDLDFVLAPIGSSGVCVRIKRRKYFSTHLKEEKVIYASKCSLEYFKLSNRMMPSACVNAQVQKLSFKLISL